MGILFGRKKAALKIRVRMSAVMDGDPGRLVFEAVQGVNEQLDAGIGFDKLPEAAVQAYYVDYFLAQHSNGGLSQFVYNSGWNPKLVEAVRKGLKAMGAKRHLAVLESLDKAVLGLGDDLDKYLEGEYFGKNDIRDELNRLNGEMDAANKAEDVTELNRKFLNASGALEPVDDSVMDQRYSERLAEHLDSIAHKPEAVKEEMAMHRQARKMCMDAGLQLKSFNGVHFGEHEDEPCIQLFLGTDRGTHYVMLLPGVARLCEYGTNRLVLEEAVPDEK